MRYVFAVFLVLLLNQTCQARQLTFTKSITGQQASFFYKWQDAAQQVHELAFDLNMADMPESQQSRTQYRPQIAQRHVAVELLKQARQIDPKQARISIEQRGDQIMIDVAASSPALVQQWQQSMQQAQQQAYDGYLQKNYYTLFRNHFGQQAVKPDHIRYAQESVNALVPAVQALYEKIPEDSESRVYINLLLSWVQSIPYSTLQDRLRSNGSGYAAPIEVLVNNRGDCDSKSVLAGALIRALLPQLPMAMIYLPNHALLGVALPHRSNENYVQLDGISYLLMEPTGPALLPLGEVAQRSLQDLGNGAYTFESFN
ncbi:hypothetical protein [Aestuariibacter salexigens]|uniref:hypothetical protein n=1 Tax=Aestuariibacter salexigens TaxID=226010 RepID=UPI001F0B6A09|nr:hypothetical protein [Aestuariibacter salexigens]